MLTTDSELKFNRAQCGDLEKTEESLQIDVARCGVIKPYRAIGEIKSESKNYASYIVRLFGFAVESGKLYTPRVQYNVILK